MVWIEYHYGVGKQTGIQYCEFLTALHDRWFSQTLSVTGTVEKQKNSPVGLGRDGCPDLWVVARVQSVAVDGIT